MWTERRPGGSSKGVGRRETFNFGFVLCSGDLFSSLANMVVERALSRKMYGGTAHQTLKSAGRVSHFVGFDARPSIFAATPAFDPISGKGSAAFI
jgi:hypothetical protein